MSRVLIAFLCLFTAIVHPSDTYSELIGTGIQLNGIETESHEVTKNSAVETSPIYTLKVSANKNCLYFDQLGEFQNRAVRHQLKGNQTYRVTANGKAFLSTDGGRHADPMPGVVLFYCTNQQDGYATQTRLLKSEEKFTFTTPRKNPEDNFLSAFFVDYWSESKNKGHYQLRIEEITADSNSSPSDLEISSSDVNINFAYKTENRSTTATGKEKDAYWNFLDYGQRSLRKVRFANGSKSNVEIEVSENDGKWGISDHTGVYHGYIYHNCRCVDLSCTVNNLPAGVYEIYVYAHGDAPDQNATIEVQSNGVTISGKSTLNDGTWDFQSTEFEDGNQYVKYVIEVSEESPVVITSKRDGSSYSMFNAIQFKRVK